MAGVRHGGARFSEEALAAQLAALALRVVGAVEADGALGALRARVREERRLQTTHGFHRMIYSSVVTKPVTCARAVFLFNHTSPFLNQMS